MPFTLKNKLRLKPLKFQKLQNLKEVRLARAKVLPRLADIVEFGIL